MPYTPKLSDLTVNEAIENREGIYTPSLSDLEEPGVKKDIVPTFLGEMPANPNLLHGENRDKLIDSLLDSLSGSATGLKVINQVSKSIPYLSKILQAKYAAPAGRAIGGGMVGYGLGGDIKSAGEGAIAGLAAPEILKQVGLRKGHPGIDIIKNVDINEVAKRANAAEELRTRISPGEASGRPDIMAMEKDIARFGKPAREKVAIGEERIIEQKNAIKNFLDKVHTGSSENAPYQVREASQNYIKGLENKREKISEPLYKISHTKKVSPNLVKSLESEYPILTEALDSVLSDAKYKVKGELLNEPRNSIKSLDYAKRYIDKKISQAEKIGDNDGVRVLNQTKNKILDAISGFSPDYKKARNIYSEYSRPIEEIQKGKIGQLSRIENVNLKNISQKIFDTTNTNMQDFKRTRDIILSQNPKAWDAIVKNEITRLMTKGKSKSINATNFLSNVLSNDIKYEQLKLALEHNPSALKDLENMKVAWEHISNNVQPKTAARYAETGLNEKRTVPAYLKDVLQSRFGHKKQSEALKFLYSTEWKKTLEKMTKGSE